MTFTKRQSKQLFQMIVSTALLTINEKDRIWWIWNNSQGLSFILKEVCVTKKKIITIVTSEVVRAAFSSDSK